MTSIHATQVSTMETGPLTFMPQKHSPEAAAHYVLAIFRQRSWSLDLAAAKLTPVFGLEQGPSQDSRAVARSQALFASDLLREPLGELAVYFLKGTWSGQVACAPRWNYTIHLVNGFTENDTYAGDQCTIPEGSNVEAYYARMLVRITRRLKSPGFKCRDLEWLRDANIENQCWVLFHAMTYLQYEAVHFNKTSMSFRELSITYTDIGQFYDEIPKLMEMRQVKKRIEQRRAMKACRKAY